MTDDDFDRTIRRWLERGPTSMSDRALQAALDEIHLTRQRPAWMPTPRVPRASAMTRFAIGAVAVLTISAVIGLSVLPGASGVRTGSLATAAASPSPTPTAPPIPLRGVAPATVLKAGVYTASTPFPIPVTFTLPAGWVGQVGGPYAVWLQKGPAAAQGGWLAGTGGAEIALTLSQRLYADPCHDRGFLDPQPTATVDGLTSALITLPGLEATTPTDVTVDGYRGKQLTLTAPGDFSACGMSPDGYVLWRLPLGAVVSFTPGGRLTLWILDVRGQPLVVSAQTQPETSSQDQAEVQAIMASIHFGPN